MKRKSTTFEVEPRVGMGATIQAYSDSYACTIIQVLYNSKRLVLQEDKATRTDNNGMSESQSYDYSPDPNGKVYFATKRKDGSFRLVGQTSLVSLDVRKKYHDYSF